MNVFELRNRLVDDYRNYTRSFIRIRDPRIKEFVDGHLGAEGFWPEPLLQLNPAFETGGTIDDLVAEGVLADECSRIFRYRESLEDHRDAQYDIPGYFTRPDFFYRDANATIYIDGPPHDAAQLIRDDDGITQALIELGYIVIHFHHTDDWEVIFGRHSNVHGVPSV